MYNSKENNITKADALMWKKENRGAFPPYKISELIRRRCFYGEEYENIDGEDRSREMSYICRAYNITEYGKSNNRIKNVFKKYTQKYDPELIADAVSQIVQQYPNGIPDEFPRFEELLVQYLEDTSDPEADYYGDEIYDDDISLSNRRAAGGSPEKVGKIALPLIAVIVLVVIIVNLKHIILPVLGGVAAVALIVFVNKKLKGSRNNTSASYGRTTNRTKGGQRGTEDAGKITLGKLAGAAAWAGIFIYAGSYYRKAGNPASWTIAAIAIGLIGAAVILFRPNNK